MIRRSPHTAWLARALLDAMGVGIAASLAACGGKVVVDTDSSESAGAGGAGSGGASGSGGAGAIGSTAVSTTASTGPGPEPPPCHPEPGPANEMVFACVSNNGGGCPDWTSSEAHVLMSGVLDKDGPCPTDPDFCWCSTSVVDVACGPEPSNLPAQCCYEVEVFKEEQCMGRPFTVAGVARLAPAARIAGWSADLRPDVASLAPATRARLAAAWTRDGLMEHASVASFARFTLEALALGAPSGLVRGAQQAMGDEIRHAELCFGLASAFGGEPVGPGALSVDRALDHAGDAAAIAAAVVREGCIGETLASLLAMAARDAATDPAVRSVLDEIAIDEASHAALAWRWVAWACERADARVIAAIRDAFETAAPPAIDDDDAHVDESTMRAFGRLSASETRDVVAAAFADVVLPCAHALLTSGSSPSPSPSPSPTPPVPALLV